MDFIYILLGLALILFGANILTDGAAAAAKRFHVSEFIIGLTVIAIGTSMPELSVSLLSALEGSTTMAIGNVLGSNMFNTLAALGMSALIRPIPYTRENIRRDIPIGILASVILLLVTLGGEIQRTSGCMMVLIYIALIYNSIVRSRRECRLQMVEASANAEFMGDMSKGEESHPIADMPLWRTLLMIGGGFAALIFGGDLLLDGATSFARHYGISEKIIAITILAGGTSLPEFAATLIALCKGKSGIALGNIIGSNIANILLVLGVTSTAVPLGVGAISMFDFSTLVGSSTLLLIFAFTPPKHRISRFDGVLLIAIYAAYIFCNFIY